jgi:UDP-2-acetamido-3-amino-2,3-dideoxy-glucuronate N-acetyltransferase
VRPHVAVQCLVDDMIEIPGRRFVNIADDVKLGRDVAIFEFVNLYGCEIGDESRIGAFVEIQREVTVGRRVRIQSHSFVCSGVRIEDDVFVGHNVTFINDRHPTAEGARTGTWKLEPTTVKRGASIGSGAVILCGLTIGERARVGAGAVVTDDVPAGALVVGVPARAVQANLQ